MDTGFWMAFLLGGLVFQVPWVAAWFYRRRSQRDNW